MSINNDQIPAMVKARAAFRNKTGSVWAERCKWTPNKGEMPDAAYNAMYLGWVEGTYVVFSYLTPIAWARPGDEFLTVPNVRYSNTTTQHQYACIRGNWNSGVGQVGEFLSVGDPGAVRKGQGKSPYGPRMGW